MSELGDVTIVAPSNGQVLVYNSSTSKWENSSGGYVPYTGAVTTVNLGAQSILAGSFVKAGGTAAQFLKANGSVDSTAYGTGSVTSVALTMPTAFSVAGSPITTAGTLAVTGAGTVGQYIRGDGSLADFPATTGGGSSVSYYLNGSVNQGTIGGVAYKELNRTPVFGAGTDISINADGYIASFITDALDPNKLLIPAGNWNFETYFSANSGGGSPSFYVELYKYNGTTFTLIASNSSAPELIAFGTNLNPYFSTLAVPETVLALTDRLALRYYVTHSGRTITLHTENGHLCEVITTFTTGLTALNGLTNQVQFFAVGTAGTDFAISSVSDTHTFNLPTASATNRGALSSADWTTFNGKTSNLGTVTSVGLSSATSGVTIGSTPITTSGTITLAIATASGSQNGLLSSTDWTTFNGKQNALTNPVTGTGASGQVAYFTGTSAITSESTLFWDSTNDRLGINTNNPQFKIDILNGDIRLNMSSGNFGIIFEGDSGLLVEGTKIWYENNTGIQFYDSYWTGAGAGHFFRTNLNGTIQNVLKLNNTGTAVFINSVTATSFIRTGGTSSQFLKADGSIDSTAYGTGTVTSVTASTPLASSGGTTPNITIQQASGSQSGFLSSTDWTTFNGKQNVITNPVTGTGTTNFLAKFTGTSTVGNSLLQDSGTRLSMTSGDGFVISTGSSITVGGGSFIALTNIGQTNWQLQQINASFGLDWWTLASGGAWGVKMTLTQSGNLLVGTTTDAGFKLDVNGTGRFSGQTSVLYNGYDSNVEGLRLGFDTNYYNAISATFSSSAASNKMNFVVSSGNGTRGTVMTLLGSGNVGIGTASPSQKLQVEGNLLVNSGTSASAFRDIMMGGIGGWSTGESHGIDTVYNTASSPTTFSRIESHFDGASGRFRFRNLFFNSSPRTDILMTIEGNGNVLIGTTTDFGAKLYVNGGIRTANPTGSTSNDWLLGRALISGTSSPDRWIRVQIGNLYYDILAVYMGSV